MCVLLRKTHICNGLFCVELDIHLHYVTNNLYVLLHGLVLCEFSDDSINNNDNNKWSKLFDERLLNILCHY